MLPIICAVTYDDLQGATKIIFDMVCMIYGFVVSVLLASTDAAANLFTSSGTLDTLGNSLVGSGGVMDTVIDALQPGAFAIAALFFSIAMVQLHSERELTLEYFIKFFARFIVSVGAIMFCKEIVHGVYDLSVGMADFFSSQTGAITASFSGGGTTFDVKSQLLELITPNEPDTKPGIFHALGLVLKIILPSGILLIAAIAIFLITYLVGFTRLLELTVRAGFMPIAVAMLADDGWRGAGGRYIRKFAGICCQSSVLIIIGALSESLMLWALTAFGSVGGGGGIAIPSLSGYGLDSHVTDGIAIIIQAIVPAFVMAAAGFAAISLMFKSIGIINDVVGG